MNKYQEALNHLKDETIENFKKKHIPTNEERTKIINDVVFLQELVEKATPHKLLKNGLCKCGARVLVSFQGYCTQCGQAIDWSEDD